MKRVSVLMLVAVMAVVAQATVIDDFDTLAGWTSTVILDANGGGSNTASWEVSSSTLQLSTTVYDGIEQYAMIKDGLSLAVGEEVQLVLSHSGASQDIGLYVGGTTPVAGTRQDYVSVYGRSTGELFSRGFNGTSEYGQVGWISPAYTKLFIARTDDNEYELGYYIGDDRSVMVTRTPSTENDATVVGIYADVRNTGTLGAVDSLIVIPEPATMVLLGLGALVLRRGK